MAQFIEKRIQLILHMIWFGIKAILCHSCMTFVDLVFLENNEMSLCAFYLIEIAYIDSLSLSSLTFSLLNILQEGNDSGLYSDSEESGSESEELSDDESFEDDDDYEEEEEEEDEGTEGSYTESYEGSEHASSGTCTGTGDSEDYISDEKVGFLTP